MEIEVKGSEWWSQRAEVKERQIDRDRNRHGQWMRHREGRWRG